MTALLTFGTLSFRVFFYMNKTVFLTLIIFFILILFLVFFWFYQVQYLTSRASNSAATFSVENSYLFISPLKAKTATNINNTLNTEKIRVTVFALNSQGLGVIGKRVELVNNVGLQVDTIQPLTDEFGKAYFDVSSAQSGDFYLEVKIGDQSLKEKVRLSFY